MIKGEKWLRNATYLTEQDREKVMEAVRQCAEETGERPMIRPASYIGEPSPFATVCYGPGQRIYRSLYR